MKGIIKEFFGCSNGEIIIPAERRRGGNNVLLTFDQRVGCERKITLQFTKTNVFRCTSTFPS